MLVGTRTSRWDKKATPGIQMHLCSFDRFQKALMYWCFRFWPPLCHLLCMIHSPLEAWSSVPSRYKTVRLGRWCCHLWDEKPFCGLITDLLVEFLKGSREMLWHVLALMFTLTMSSSLSSTAVLNMDNAVVDHETLQALYENVSIDILQCCLELHCLFNSYCNKSFWTSFWPLKAGLCPWWF